ncbi:MAG: DUF721 domain-containing protein [Bacteroidetes bacterium]|nr:DUF721 domain-containing protein [Bacteroidota bacterium]MBS1617245.1 DUF721 domain-containing protein [Bacteroidota bacterium]
MRKTNTVTLGAAIQSVLAELNLRHGVYEARVEAMWERVMGRSVARHTTAIRLKADRLYITVDSAPLRSELFYSRMQIRDVVNQELGVEVINDVFIY